jgi:hypothetical protein
MSSAAVLVSSLRDTRAPHTFPGTYVPGYCIPPLRGWHFSKSSFEQLLSFQLFPPRELPMQPHAQGGKQLLGVHRLGQIF